MWYSWCDEFEIETEGNCNLKTLGNAQVKWYSSDVGVFMWELIKDADGLCGEKMFLTPIAYDEGEMLQTDDEVCGYEF